MQQRSILIVEDEAIVAMDLRAQLQKLGYKICGTAGTASEAKSLVERLKPDLALMDIQLQGPEDGISAAQAICQRHRVPVIFLTAFSDEDTVRRAAGTAAYGYLTKPFQIKELRAGIEIALSKAAMERQLREADLWFVHTLRCVSDGVIVTDADGKVRFLNLAAEMMSRWVGEDAAGRSIAEVVRFESDAGRLGSARDGADATGMPADVLRIVREVKATGRPVPVAHELKLISQDGHHLLVDMCAGPVIDDEGKLLGVAVVLRDATERAAQEERLRASEARFRVAFDHAPLGVALVSLSGKIIQANAAMGRLLDLPPDALKGIKLTNLASELDREHERSRLNELQGPDADVVQYETNYVRMKDGRSVPALVSVSLMREASGPTCYLYQVLDLTEQKEAAQRLAALADERIRRQASEMAARSKTEFLSQVSHEMRTPLNAVIGFAQLLEMQQAQDPQRLLSYARHIRIAGEHLQRLVNDVLDVNLSGQGALSLDLQPVDVAECVSEVKQLLSGLAGTRSIGIQACVPAGLKAAADPTRLRQILLNIGTNAIKYNRSGGQVEFKAQGLPDGRVRISVEDSGIGMTSEQLDKLYRPFDRLGQEQSEIPGLGLGLAIAKGLALAMDAQMYVRSAPRVGTTVDIEFEAAA